MEDSRIVEMYFSRDENAVTETDSKYGKRLGGISYRITENEQDAEECVNDTYVEAWERIPPARPTYLFPFLAKIVRHISLDLCDKRNAQKRSAVLVELSAELENCLSSPNDEYSIEAEQLARTVNSFLRSLDRETQYIFMRRYFYSDSIAEISQKVVKSESSVTSVLFRARNKLKKLLDKEGIGI